MSPAETHAAHKTALARPLPRLLAEPLDEAGRLLAGASEAETPWRLSHPINTLCGPDAFAAGFLAPLRAAFPDAERRTDILIGGAFEGSNWVAVMGHYAGTFAAPFLGIPATQGLAFLRSGEFYRIERGAIAEALILLDLVDLMRQAGAMPPPKSPGAELLVPGPATHDGILLGASDAEESRLSRDLMEAMAAGLRAYDGRSLESMGQERFWHRTMMWYGPCGIGSNRGLKGFQTYHQIPFLAAFPDRRGAGHRARFGDGRYACLCGWPSPKATHSGPYLGVPATGRGVTMRVMDFYRREGDRLAENWVFIDLPDLMLQLGVDLLPAA